MHKITEGQIRVWKEDPDPEDASFLPYGERFIVLNSPSHEEPHGLVWNILQEGCVLEWPYEYIEMYTTVV